MPVEKFLGASTDSKIEIEVRRNADAGDSIQDILLEHLQGEPVPSQHFSEMTQGVKERMAKLADKVADTINFTFIFGLAIGPEAFDLSFRRLTELQQELLSGNWPEDAREDGDDHPHAGYAGTD